MKHFVLWLSYNWKICYNTLKYKIINETGLAYNLWEGLLTGYHNEAEE
jgi:hypothetical protein